MRYGNPGRGNAGEFLWDYFVEERKINTKFKPIITIEKSKKMNVVIGTLLHEMLHYKHYLKLKNKKLTKAQISGKHTKKFCLENKVLAQRLLIYYDFEAICYTAYKKGL